MLSLKKIALLGVAGLTAFSMSCSDDGSEAGGSIDKLVITDGATLSLTGTTVTVNDGVKATAVTASVTGKTPAVNGVTGLNTGTLSFAAAYLTGVCGTDKGAQSYDITITVAFDDGTTVSETKNGVSVDCGGSTPAPAEGEYTLGYNSPNKSYLDVDGKAYYSQGDLATAGVKGLIDLVSFYSSASDNKIYSACYASTIGLTDCEEPAIYNTEEDLDNDENEIEGSGLVIAKDKVFYLFSTEADEFKVTITAVATSSVTLKVEAL